MIKFKPHGAKRLLKLAAILDKADALHKKKGEPTYKQWTAEHACGTPACAGGHWNHYMKVGNNGERDGDFVFNDTFDITDEDWSELFSASGCGQAKTAKAAAKFIRAFVKNKLKELSK